MSSLLNGLYCSSGEGLLDHPNDLFDRAQDRQKQLGNALKSALGAEHKALFYEYEVALNAASDAECFESFCKGYSLCLRLIVEGLMGKI